MGNELPFVYLNVAMTADGKIAPANRHYLPFSSKTDQQFLYELRTRADAVMSGARTVDLFPVTMGPGSAKYRKMRLKNGLNEYNLRVIVSGSGTIDPQAAIFRHRFSPIIVLTTDRATKGKLAALRAIADEVKICGEKDLDFRFAFHWLRKKWGVQRLLCEGGGEVNGALFDAGLVNEVYLTLCPVIFGGRRAPTVADGTGVKQLSHATKLEIRSVQRVGAELFLRYSARG